MKTLSSILPVFFICLATIGGISCNKEDSMPSATPPAPVTLSAAPKTVSAQSTGTTSVSAALRAIECVPVGRTWILSVQKVDSESTICEQPSSEDQCPFPHCVTSRYVTATVEKVSPNEFGSFDPVTTDVQGQIVIYNQGAAATQNLQVVFSLFNGTSNASTVIATEQMTNIAVQPGDSLVNSFVIHYGECLKPLKQYKIKAEVSISNRSGNVDPNKSTPTAITFQGNAGPSNLSFDVWDPEAGLRFDEYGSGELIFFERDGDGNLSAVNPPICRGEQAHLILKREAGCIANSAMTIVRVQ